MGCPAGAPLVSMRQTGCLWLCSVHDQPAPQALPVAGCGRTWHITVDIDRDDVAPNIRLHTPRRISSATPIRSWEHQHHWLTTGCVSAGSGHGGSCMLESVKQPAAGAAQAACGQAGGRSLTTRAPERSHLGGVAGAGGALQAGAQGVGRAGVHLGQRAAGLAGLALPLLGHVGGAHGAGNVAPALRGIRPAHRATRDVSSGSVLHTWPPGTSVAQRESRARRNQTGARCPSCLCWLTAAGGRAGGVSLGPSKACTREAVAQVSRGARLG